MLSSNTFGKCTVFLKGPSYRGERKIGLRGEKDRAKERERKLKLKI